jgi:two-component system sensor histidine kinase DesK
VIYRRWFRRSPALVGQLFANAFMVPLIAGIVHEVAAPQPPARRYALLVGTVAFIAVYEWFWFRGLRKEGAASTLVPLIGLVILGVAISLAFVGWLALLIYASTVAGMGFDFGWRKALIAVAAVTAVSGVMTILLRTAGLHDGDPVYVFQTALSGVSLLAIGQLVHTNIELKQAREAIADLAVNEERLRFARDLHDLLGHSLSLIVLKAELSARLSQSPERARKEVEDIERVARDALREVRETVAGYRQPTLGQELQNAREVLRASGIQWHCEHTAGPLPGPVEAVMAWAVRESITNVVRHSSARHCRIEISREDDSARLIVEDDGAGCGQVVPGSGLRGLSERADERGGRAEAVPLPERGFRVRIAIPVSEPQPEAASA